jgi:hypothetical protein
MRERADVWGPRGREREGRVRWRGLVGRQGSSGWAAAKRGKEGNGPQHRLDLLQIKDLSFELRFEIEFEFVSHSNSNCTHSNSK